jgi:hypothetical protein
MTPKQSTLMIIIGILLALIFGMTISSFQKKDPYEGTRIIEIQRNDLKK